MFNPVIVDIKDHFSYQMQSKEANFFMYESAPESFCCFRSSISRKNTFQCSAIIAIEQEVLENKPESNICVEGVD